MPMPLACVPLALLALAPAGPGPTVGGPLDELVAAAERRGMRIGLAAVVVDDGTRLAWHRPEEALAPASNQKLLTTAAFLEALGPDHRFRTGFAVEAGDLRLFAGADPNWIPGGPLDPATTFATVAARLRDAGVTELGRLRFVRGPYDGPARPDAWPADQLERTYCAPTGAVALDQGCWRLRLAVGDDPRQAAATVITPLAGLDVDGAITLTDDRRKGGVYRVDRRGDRLVLGGHLWRKAEPRDVFAELAASAPPAMGMLSYWLSFLG